MLKSINRDILDKVREYRMLQRCNIKCFSSFPVWLFQVVPDRGLLQEEGVRLFNLSTGNRGVGCFGGVGIAGRGCPRGRSFRFRGCS